MAHGIGTVRTSALCALTGVAVGRALLQAERGDVTGERPMWSNDGGIDYQGHEEFDAWSKAKVRTPAAGILPLG